jgi:predicted transcriptional regulator
MAHEVSVHEAQTAILRELLFKPDAAYSELRKKTELESDHFKFHIRRLVEMEFIAKNDTGRYYLTQKGKEYANKIDTDRDVIERQPKSAVIIVLQNDQGEVLVQERLKHPYFGFWGYPGGKIRWGETIMVAAARELREETGLSAALQYRGVYHEHVISAENGEMLEDKIFHVIAGSKPDGALKGTFEGGRSC